ncbi:MAG: DUF2156 domain-containing protein [Anaerorhabdus sp.]
MKATTNGIKEKLKQNLKEFEISDGDKIKHYLEKCEYEESNHNLVNMVMWLDEFPLYYYEEEMMLLVFGIHQGEVFMYMPLCAKSDFKEAIKKAGEIFKQINEPLLFSCFTIEMAELALKLSDSYKIEQVVESSDYVYDAQKLQVMSGKKLQKKRNHINAFEEEYSGRYEYESINEENAKECLAFLEHWKDEDEDLFLKQDHRGSEHVLKLIGQLPSRGGCIRIDGKIEAFAIGSWLSKEMVQENIEKANNAFRGLYPLMLREFLKHEFPNAIWVNREDDMGYENLRRSKRSYDPVRMVDKYRVTLKEGDK